MNKDSIQDSIRVVLLAGIWVLFSFWLQGNIGIGLLDEGWLWYGAWRTGLGEVPIRDFWSYDPGRYYWVAGWSMLFGHGIIGLRASVAVFQFLGLIFGLLALRRLTASWCLLAVFGGLLLVWLVPRCKIFDHSIALAGVYFAVLLIERPSVARHFGAGIFVGRAAFFGRNHGFYGLISFFSLILFIWFRIEKSDLARRMAAWALGIVIGYSPMVFMCIGIGGFWDRLVDSVLILFRIKGTNLPLPVPWPWTGGFLHMSLTEAVAGISTGLLFVMLPLLYVLGGLAMIWTKGDALRKRAVLVAALFVGAPYVHYAFSRADISHLALGIPPFLIGVISLPFVCKYPYRRVIGGGLVALVLVLSYFSVVTSSPYGQKTKAAKGEFVKTDIHGDSIWLPRYTAALFRTVAEIHSQSIGPGEGLLIAPH